MARVDRTKNYINQIKDEYFQRLVKYIILNLKMKDLDLEISGRFKCNKTNTPG